MSTHLSRRDILTFLLSAVACLGTACASLVPPVESSTEPDPQALHIDAHRADDEGLALTIHARDASTGDELELWRRSDDGEWAPAQVLDINPALADALSTGRVEWRDRPSQRDASLQYQMRLRNNGHETTSAPIDIDWRGVPDPPAVQIEVDEGTPALELVWKSDISYEVHIERRDVLDGGDYALLIVIDPGAGSGFQDSGVVAGGVYSYRLRFVDRHSHLPRYGSFSESHYVSLPE